MQTVRDVLNDHEKELLKDYSAIMEFVASDVFLNKYVANIYGYAEHRYSEVIKKALRESFQRFEGMPIVVAKPDRIVQIRLRDDLMILYNYSTSSCDILFDVYIDGKWAGRRFIDSLYVIEDEET